MFSLDARVSVDRHFVATRAPETVPRWLGWRLKWSSTVVLLLIFVAGCHTMRFQVTNEPHAQIVYARKSFYLWGLTPTQKIDVSNHCPAGVAAIREETRFSDGFFSFITLGIWQPRSSWYYCLEERL